MPSFFLFAFFFFIFAWPAHAIECGGCSVSVRTTSYCRYAITLRDKQWAANVIPLASTVATVVLTVATAAHPAQRRALITDMIMQRML